MKYKDVFKKKRPCPFDHPKPEDVILKNESVYVTYALAPYHRDHLLVVPRRHVIEILEMTKKEMEDTDAMLDKLWKLYRKNFKYRNVSFLLREGKGSGASLSHLHYHIIPEVKIGNMIYTTQAKSDNRKTLSPRQIKNEIKRIKAILK